MLLTAGERISMALLAMAIQEEGLSARSFTGSQAGIITDSVHGKAKILDITPGRITTALAEGHVVIVAGFQGVSRETKDVTTLGRGGTDTTAVALASALGARVCEIYTDVDGVYTADPRIVPTAKKVDHITAEEMLELAAHGAGVLHTRSVEFGRNHGVDIHVRSSFSHHTGTWVHARAEDMPMEQAIISGVAHDRSESKVTVRGVPDKPGVAAQVFTSLADATVNVDMIVQNVSATGTTDMTFTIPMAETKQARDVLEPLLSEVGAQGLEVDDQIGNPTSAHDRAGMKTTPGIAARMFTALSDAGVNIDMISTSTIRISVVVDESDVEPAVNAIHSAFDLDGDGPVAVEGKVS